MAENLKTRKYNDGTEILLVANNDTWKNSDTTKTPMICWYNNDTKNKDVYGGYYNGYVVDSTTNGGKNVCPIGWHIPSDDEWTTLIDYIGDNAGQKLKSSSNWTTLGGSKANGTDVYGFLGLSSGTRFNDGEFLFVGTEGSFLTSTFLSTPIGEMIRRRTLSSKDEVESILTGKSFGLSIRCVKD